jgi:hypothetical protein
LLEGCPLRDAGIGFKRRDFGGDAGTDKPP